MTSISARAYGVTAAAMTYFYNSPDELTLGEAAFLAWQHKMPYRMGSGSGSSVTASPDISKGVGASGRWI